MIMKRATLLIVVVLITATLALANPASSSGSSIYWGAGIDGKTYGYLYGGTWNNPP